MKKKSFVKDNSKLMKEWDYEKNNKIGINPDDILPGSQKKVNWICSKGHKYERSVYDKLNGRGNCPYCGNRKILQGFNDIATTNPELLTEWNYDKNDKLNITPESIGKGYSKKIWWKCGKGHEWDSAIYSRIAGSGCPYCSNQKIKKGYNDIATTNPELLKEWDYEKNDKIGITPFDVSHGSTKKVWWRCENGHEYQTSIAQRTGKKSGCAICANQQLLKGYNDFATRYPVLMKEWDYEENDKKGIRPDEIVKGGKVKISWKCEKGHKWETRIADRIRSNNAYNRCPICSSYQRVSYPEKVIYYYVKKMFPNAKDNFKPDWLKPKEIDIFIPELNIGIEYDGSYWHSDTKEDIDKERIIYTNNCTLIRVRERDCVELKHSKAEIYELKNRYQSDGSHVLDAVRWIAKKFDKRVEIDFEKDLLEINKLIEREEKENALMCTDSDKIQEWNYEKNEKLGITPYNITRGSSVRVWWKCKNGHDYTATISTKINQDTGCPYCAKKKLLKGFNDFVTVYPELLKEWCYDKNKLLPEETIGGTNKDIWWQCDKGHKFKSSVAARLKGCGCPYCSGHQHLKGYNDIATTNPEILEEWDYERNNKMGILPENIRKGYREKVWWKCKNGHSYLSSVNNRITHHTDCPYCKGKQVLKGYNDIATTNPELLTEWDYRVNDKLGITPDSISRGSDKKVYWLCSKNHSYSASVSNKFNGRGCPYCSGAKVLKGFNDLETTNPELLDKWNYERNNELGINPNNISKSYSKKVWWKCSEGHEYQRHVYNQRKGLGKCPECRKK